MCLHKKAPVLESGMCFYSGDKANPRAVWNRYAFNIELNMMEVQLVISCQGYIILKDNVRLAGVANNCLVANSSSVRDGFWKTGWRCRCSKQPSIGLRSLLYEIGRVLVPV